MLINFLVNAMRGNIFYMHIFYLVLSCLVIKAKSHSEILLDRIHAATQHETYTTANTLSECLILYYRLLHTLVLFFRLLLKCSQSVK